MMHIRGNSAIDRFRLGGTGSLALGFLLVAILAAIFAPFLVRDPYAQDVAHALIGPSRPHWFGLDGLGRDIAARVVYGARVSLGLGVLSALVALGVGATLGAISGFWGGTVDRLLMRTVEVFDSIPTLLAVVLLKEIFEQGRPERGIWAIVGAIGFLTWVQVARIVRGEVLHLKERAYVEAAHALGLSPWRILLRHILPNLIPVLLVILTLRIPQNILTESLLGFVGLGVRAPLASWGTMASEGWSAMRFFPHVIFFPSLALSLCVLSMNILADRFRDHLQRR